MSYPEISQSQPNDEALQQAVDARISSLVDSGAEHVLKVYSVASAGQSDLIYQGRRLLVTPNNNDYKNYAAVMAESGMPYISNDPELGDEQVVVGEIPRDARLTTQIARSVYPQEGVKPSDVFWRLGQRIGTLATAHNLLPKPEDFTLTKILALRSDVDAMLVPPMHFQTSAPDAREDLKFSLRRQLEMRLSRFGGTALSQAFEKGLEDA